MIYFYGLSITLGKPLQGPETGQLCRQYCREDIGCNILMITNSPSLQKPGLVGDIKLENCM
jgi:hypothetical protein